jgi:transposase
VKYGLLTLRRALFVAFFTPFRLLSEEIQGRKRHILVDTQGFVLAVKVHAADIADRDGAKLLLAPLADRFPRLQLIWADGAYTGKIRTWVQETLHWGFQIVQHPWAGIRGVWVKEGMEVDWDKIIPKGFHVLPRRWVVERTFSWLTLCRRLARDYEGLCQTSETMIYVAMTRLMVNRLAKKSA